MTFATQTNPMAHLTHYQPLLLRSADRIGQKCYYPYRSFGSAPISVGQIC